MTGSGNWNWNKNLIDGHRTVHRDTHADYRFKRDVCERADYTCQCCGYKGQKSKNQRSGGLVSHHLDGYHWAIDERYDPSNGVLLCKDCHKEFHKTHGIRNNTREQFNQWIQLESTLA